MSGPLGILAGGGHLPRRLVELCQSDGRGAFVVAIEDNTEASTVEGVDHLWIKLGQTKRALDALRGAGVSELVMIGPVKRPTLSELRPDAYTLKALTKIKFNRLGDDGILGTLVKTLETEGFTVRGVDELMGDLLAVAGPYGRCVPDEQAQSDIERGIAVVQAMGAADVGQATVIQNGIVLGVEATEGTDALLERCGPLRRDGLGGVLVKLSKPGQERRADLPTVGVKTVEAAAAAGLRGIAIEAGGTLVVDTDAVARAADRAGLFLVGIDLSA